LKSLSEFVEGIAGFGQKPAAYKIQVFGAYLHEVQGISHFGTAAINTCCDDLHLPRLSNTGVFVKQMLEKKPPQLLKDKNGLRLSSSSREAMTFLTIARPSAVKTTALLNSLVDKLTNPVQKTFLEETLVCFKHHAFRASIVMAWNLAWNDVLDRILANHLTAFNSQVGTFGFKRAIAIRSDFENLKDADIVKIGRAAHIFDKETVKTLEEKLGKRNTSAHPSAHIVTPATAEEVISDLVLNIVLKPVL
jgi:hypothetical protein